MSEAALDQLGLVAEIAATALGFFAVFESQNPWGVSLWVALVIGTVTAGLMAVEQGRLGALEATNGSGRITNTTSTIWILLPTSIR